jgi:phosphatidylglycerol:prolipoprotein diacylglycerol transferase
MLDFLIRRSWGLHPPVKSVSRPFNNLSNVIPYVEIPELPIWGPLSVKPFGLLVAVSCLTALYVARWHAGTTGLDKRLVDDLIIVWVLVPAFVFSHWVSMLLYFPAELAARPVLFFYFWGSMSSFGGFLGGALGAIWFIKRKGLPLWEYLDTVVVALCSGWFFGRLGCAITHDHPGIASDFLLAVQYPGGARHDLGLYEWLLTLVLVPLVFYIRAKKPAPGTITAVVPLVYGPVRFMLDFLRVEDKLYLGLTPGQYFSIALFIVGAWVLIRQRDAAPKRRGAAAKE